MEVQPAKMMVRESSSIHVFSAERSLLESKVHLLRVSSDVFETTDLIAITPEAKEIDRLESGKKHEWL